MNNSTSHSTYEEYLEKNGELTYRNVGVSMMPLLKQDRDLFTVRKKVPGEPCKKWDVVLYHRPPGSYLLHRVIRVNPGSYDILGDNCMKVEYSVPEDAIMGIMTEFVHKGRKYTVQSGLYKLYVALWCKPYPLRIFFKKVKRRCGRFYRKVMRKR